MMNDDSSAVRRHDGMLRGGDMRARFVSIAILLGFLVLILRGALVAMGPEEAVRPFAGIVAEGPRRADIVDRNGELLATSVSVWSLYGNPRAMMDGQLVADELMRALPDLDRDLIAERLSDRSRAFVWIQRGLTPRQRQDVFELGLEGLGFRQETRRAYPKGTLAGHLIGFAGADGQGLSGVEYASDKRLADGGDPVRLTIDANVQFSLEAELRDGVQAYEAEAGAGIVLDARRGDILAMASWPPLDPNRATRLAAKDPSRLNRATGAVYELGSVFKPLTVGAALDYGAISLNQTFEVTDPIELRGRKITDTHPISARATPLEIVSDSSNIGTVKIGWMLSPEQHRASLDALGLTETPRLPLTGVEAPLLPAEFGDLTRATVSFGHGIAVSPLALASAYTVFANDGARAAPRLILDSSSETRLIPVWSAETARNVLDMLRHAVHHGTGGQADIVGYRVAGKTGTAEKPSQGGYSETENVSSFAAVFPADSPQFVVLIVLDAPKAGKDRGRTASWNAAPTAGRVIERIAPILGVTPELDAAETSRLSDQLAERNRL